MLCDRLGVSERWACQVTGPKVSPKTHNEVVLAALDELAGA